MSRNIYKALSIMAAAISAIGLASFLGGMRRVNIGAFIFPFLIGGVFLFLYKKKQMPVC